MSAQVIDFSRRLALRLGVEPPDLGEVTAAMRALRARLLAADEALSLSVTVAHRAIAEAEEQAKRNASLLADLDGALAVLEGLRP